ncbi:MAG TPA: PAS domain-containing sensor histidine kinase, partial [Firmicutes bacterium]|nr:PAS domain-containing sensor histidine kinase [Bacillota bacterium]
MRPRRLLWQIYPLYLLITALSLAAVTWYATRIVRGTYLKRTREELAIRAHLVEPQMASLWDTRDAEAIGTRVRRVAQDSTARITLVLPDGKILADSEEEPASMGNHADRPEIQQALAGQVGSSVRFSDTTRQNMMYVAVPLQQQGRIAGVVRVSVPVSFVDDALGHF